MIPTHITTVPPTHDPNDDDDDHSNQSDTLLGSQASSHNPSPLKRRHTAPPTTYVTFTTPIDDDIATITNTLLHELDSEPSDHFRYYFQHHIANKLKSKDPEALAAISLLVES